MTQGILGIYKFSKPNIPLFLQRCPRNTVGKFLTEIHANGTPLGDTIHGLATIPIDILYILRATPSGAGPFGSLGLPFGGLGASILAPRETILSPREHPGEPFWHLGTALEDHGRDGHEVVGNKIFIDFMVILGPVCISFLSSRSLKCHLFFGLVSRLLVYVNDF